MVRQVFGQRLALVRHRTTTHPTPHTSKRTKVMTDFRQNLLKRLDCRPVIVRLGFKQLTHEPHNDDDSQTGLQATDRQVTQQVTALIGCLQYTHTHSFNGRLSGTTRVSGTREVKPIWILLKQETVSGSGISWAICKSVPRSRQITTPAPHHSVSYRLDALPAAQPTASMH